MLCRVLVDMWVWQAFDTHELDMVHRIFHYVAVAIDIQHLSRIRYSETTWAPKQWKAPFLPRYSASAVALSNIAQIAHVQARESSKSNIHVQARSQEYPAQRIGHSCLTPVSHFLLPLYIYIYDVESCFLFLWRACSCHPDC